MSDTRNPYLDEARSLVDRLFPNSNPKIKERFAHLAMIHHPVSDFREVQFKFLEFVSEYFAKYPTLEFGQSIAVADSAADLLFKMSRAAWLPDKETNPYAAAGGPPAPAAQRN